MKAHNISRGMNRIIIFPNLRYLLEFRKYLFRACLFSQKKKYKKVLSLKNRVSFTHSNGCTPPDSVLKLPIHQTEKNQLIK